MWRLINFSIILLPILLERAVSEDCGVDNPSLELKLHSKLTCKYDKSSRPVKDHTQAVNVKFSMMVKSVTYSHQASPVNYLTVNSWMYLTWRDEYLVWNPEEFGGLTETLMLGFRIWTPDIFVQNSAVNFVDSVAGTSCKVQYNGTVICIPPMIHMTLCNMNYANWPRDRHECTVTFGTWRRSGEQVNLLLDDNLRWVMLDQYQENKYWDLISTNASRNPGVYPNFDETYPVISYKFVLQRHLSTLSIRLWMPIIAMMSMTGVALLLKLESIERGALLLFNVSCHFVSMASSDYYLPSTGAIVPNLLVYYRDTTIIACLLLLETALLRNLIKYTNIECPEWVTKSLAMASDTTAGKIIFYEFDHFSDIKRGDDDVESLTPENVKRPPNSDWKKFAVLMNRLFTIAVLSVYALIIIKYLC